MGPTRRSAWKMVRAPILLFFLAQFLWISSSGQKSIPFRYVRSLILIEVQIGHAKPPLVFLVSTGSNLSVIDRVTAQKLGLVLEEGMDSVMGTAGKEPYAHVRIPSLSIGSQQFENLSWGCRYLSDLVRYGDQPIDGILGTDFLRQFVMDIDFTNHKLRIRKEANRSTSSSRIPFQMEDGLPKVSVRINDTLETALRYNSGSSVERSQHPYLNLSHFQWAELKGKQRFLPHVSHSVAKGVGGYLYLQVVRLESLKAGNMTTPYPYAIIQEKEGCFAEPESIGFFGNSLLEGYGRISLDFIHEEIILASPSF